MAAVTRTHVNGTDPVPWVPPQPTSSPWATEPVGQERPLGFSVEDMIPVGEPHEVASSFGEVSPDAAGSLLPAVVEQALPGDGQRSDTDFPHPPALKSRRRRLSKQRKG